MTKYIHLPVEQKRKLERLFGVSHVTVWSALNYTTNSDLARKIRKAAHTLGGIDICARGEYRPNCEDRCERRDDGSIRRITKTFANGVQAVLDYDCETGRLYQNGMLCKSNTQPTILEWHTMVSEALTLSETRAR